MRKHNSTTKEDIETVIMLDLNGEYQSEISEKTGIHQQCISSILNYYRGKNNQLSRSISPHNKKLIDEIGKVKTIPNHNKPKYYEVILFFGLVKIRFKPVY